MGDLVALASKTALMLISFATLVAHAQIPYPNPFKHVVVIIQENRTPDNLFRGLLSWTGINPANYNIATSGLNSKGQIIQLTPVPLGVNYDLRHDHSSFRAMYDGGKMDGADRIPCSGTCPPNPQFSYVDNSRHTIDPYLTLAAQYGWANFMFQTNQGPSFPAHQFLFGGTSAPSTAMDGEGMYMAENPSQPSGSLYSSFNDTGCLAPLGEWDLMIRPNGTEIKMTNSVPGTFCFSRETMASLLDAAGLTWKYYAQKQTRNPGGSNSGGSIWTAPNAIQQICQPDANYTQCTGPEWAANVDLNPPDVLRGIAACKLANVSWVTPNGGSSDHPGSASSTGGPSWVASVVNAVGNAASCDGGAGYWSDTAILITWDDWGGWYDHEPPTILPAPFGDYQYGFRVPLVVVSAYTPAAYSNNERLDFGSMLRFIEGVFNIPEGALAFADARATSDLSQFFNFTALPRSFQPIPAPLDGAFFINDKRPAEPPDSD